MKTVLSIAMAMAAISAGPAWANADHKEAVDTVRMVNGEVGLPGVKAQASLNEADLDAVAEGRLSLPFSTNQLTAIYKLVRLNIQIYREAGWEYGRMIAIRKGWADPGPWPGPSIARHFRP